MDMDALLEKAQAGDAKAMFELGLFTYSSDPAEGLDWLVKAALTKKRHPQSALIAARACLQNAEQSQKEGEWQAAVDFWEKYAQCMEFLCQLGPGEEALRREGERGLTQSYLARAFLLGRLGRRDQAAAFLELANESIEQCSEP